MSYFSTDRHKHKRSKIHRSNNSHDEKVAIEAEGVQLDHSSEKYRRLMRIKRKLNHRMPWLVPGMQPEAEA